MALKRLTTAEMVQISTLWTTKGSAARKAMESVPELSALLPKIDAAHEGLHAARPAETDPRLAEIAAEAADVDARHDAVVRGIDFVLQGLALLATDEAAVQAIEQTRRVLTPDGLSIVSTSYRNEAGAAALLESRLASEPSAKAVLASFNVDKKRTLVTLVTERIRLARKLGALEDERAQRLAQAGEPAGSATVDARNAWIRVVNALVAIAVLAELSDVDRAMIFGALQQTEAKADRRNRARPEVAVADGGAAPAHPEGGAPSELA